MDAHDDAQNRDGAAGADAAELCVHPVDLRDYVKFVSSEATKVRVFQTENLALELWCLEPRATAGPLHYPDKDVTYTVIAGRSWFITDDGEVGLDPMGAMLVPADVAHGFENRSPDPLIVIAHASPPGEGANADPADTTAAAIQYQREQGGVMRRALTALLGSERNR